jgi:surface polysaccharide O-acyltransferase-like enzyme
MSITPEISHRIKLLRFPLIVGVVFIHAEMKKYSSYPVSDWVQFGVENISRVSVPLLFLISGYLFFSNFDFTWKTYPKKLKSRLGTILIPYIFWNLAFLVLLWIVQLNPTTSSFILKRYQRFIWTEHINYIDYFLDAFVGTKDTFPVSVHLWYLRDLIVVVFLAPLFWVLAKKIPYIALIALTFPWIIDGYASSKWVSVMFFYLGSLLAIQDINFTIIDRYRKFIIPLYLVMAAIVVTNQTLGKPEIVIWKNLTLFCGLLTLWCLSNLLRDRVEMILLKLSPFAFFVYLAHEPSMMFTKKMIYRIAPPSDSLGVLIEYFLMTFGVILFTLGIAILLEKYTPKFYHFITGSRS